MIRDVYLLWCWYLFDISISSASLPFDCNVVGEGDGALSGTLMRISRSSSGGCVCAASALLFGDCHKCCDQVWVRSGTNSNRFIICYKFFIYWFLCCELLTASFTNSATCRQWCVSHRRLLSVDEREACLEQGCSACYCCRCSCGRRMPVAHWRYKSVIINPKPVITSLTANNVWTAVKGRTLGLWRAVFASSVCLVLSANAC